jgi:hypothetical protein
MTHLVDVAVNLAIIAILGLPLLLLWLAGALSGGRW